MSLFVALAVLLVVAALTPVVLALVRGRVAARADRRAQNLGIARERLSELEAELAGGRIDRAQYDETRSEIEATLAEDVRVSEPERVDAGTLWTGRWTAVALLLVMPWATAAVYMAVGTPDALRGDVRAQAAAGNPHAGVAGAPQGDQLPSVEEMVAALQARLEQEPDSAEGWYLLGRSYMSMESYAEAAAAFERFLALRGDDPIALLSLADAVAMSQGGRLAGRPAELIERALAVDPQSSMGLWLAGMAAEQAGDDGRALGHWRRLYPLLDDDPESQAQLAELIAQAEARTGEAASVATIAESPVMPAPDQTGAAAAQTSPGPDGAATPVSIGVRVRLDPALSDRVAGGDTLFVFARADQGPPMPLAVARHRASELPLSVILDDSMAMMPAMRLSNFERIRIEARVSKSGMATAQTGDLAAEAVVVAVADSGRVDLVIDKVLP